MKWVTDTARWWRSLPCNRAWSASQDVDIQGLADSEGGKHWSTLRIGRPLSLAWLGASQGARHDGPIVKGVQVSPKSGMRICGELTI